MDLKELEKIRALRRELHDMPELSGGEARTRARIMRFLSENTTLELHDEGLWLWAAHRERGARGRMAFRADFDAVAAPDGRAGHFCGHDGHAAALCALALRIEGRRLGRDVYLIFQHAEETGEGGAVCAGLLARERIDEVYGCHNLPGYALGEICLRRGTFACASRGLVVKLHGSSAHAAYPEFGKNPARALCALVGRLDEFCQPQAYAQRVMATVVGVRIGRRAFGMAAAEGEVCLTLRAHRNADLEALEARILAHCRERAEAEGLRFEFERADVFPATENDDRCVDRLEACLRGARYLAEPMRWSEDFGWYLLEGRGAYFGIGAGEAQPALHTPDYEYPDALLERTAEAFYAIAADQTETETKE